MAGDPSGVSDIRTVPLISSMCTKCARHLIRPELSIVSDCTYGLHLVFGLNILG